MAEAMPTVRRIPSALFWLLALLVSVAAAWAVPYVRVVLLSVGLFVELVLYGALAWLFGRHARPAAAWWVSAPLVLIGQLLYAWTSVASMGVAGELGPGDYVRATLLEGTPWKVITVLIALGASWLGARAGRAPGLA